MPLIKILSVLTAVFFTANLVQCGRESNLREAIGEERQACLTRFSEAETEYQKELARVQKDMAEASARAVALLTDEIARTEEARHQAELSRREVETRLSSAMDRLNQENPEWGDTLVPSYLLAE